MIYFLTFGHDGNYKDAALRVSNEAKKTNLFDVILTYTAKDLQSDTEFWNQHSEFIHSNHKGYGYWLWKSYLILKTFQQMQDNDILLYADGGCEIDSNKKELINDLFQKVDKDLIISSYWNSDGRDPSEKVWSKKDLLIHLGFSDNPTIHNRQSQATSICFKKCEKTLRFVNEWYLTSCNYHLLDDSPSIQPNYHCFLEHRHDQSIFSLLVKKYELCSENSLSSAIYLSRNRSGKINY